MSSPLPVIDHQIVSQALTWARLEIGLRDVWICGLEYRGKIGIGRNTCGLSIKINDSDLYDVMIYQDRKIKGLPTRSVLKSRNDVYLDQLYPIILGDWCDLCEERCW